MYNKVSDIIEIKIYIVLIYILRNFSKFSLYKEEKIDGTNSGVKWSCPSIHDLMNILKNLKLKLILEDVFDKRLTKLEDLPMIQLKDECTSRNLQKSGRKVLLLKTL